MSAFAEDPSCCVYCLDQSLMQQPTSGPDCTRVEWTGNIQVHHPVKDPVLDPEGIALVQAIHDRKKES